MRTTPTSNGFRLRKKSQRPIPTGTKSSTAGLAAIILDIYYDPDFHEFLDPPGAVSKVYHKGLGAV
jgi:hypothetical protein